MSCCIDWITTALIANINVANADDGIQEEQYSQEAKDKLREQMREFDERLSLDKQRLRLDQKKAEEDASIKREALRRKPVSSNKK